MLGISQSFRCPNCNEYIDTDAKECRFCGHQVDPEAAARAAADQDKINRACNEANNVRNVAGVLLILTVLRWVPFIGCFAGIASLILFFGTLAMLIVWEVRYASIRTMDPDFAVAKRNRLIGFALWLASMAVFIVEVAVYVLAGLAGSRLR
jgi:hypothetical protein